MLVPVPVWPSPASVSWPGSGQNPGRAPAKRQQFAETQPALGAAPQSGRQRCLQAGDMPGSKSQLLGGSAARSQGKVALGLVGTCQPGRSQPMAGLMMP